ncbi:heme transporter hrg1-B-like [Acanthaster planci]|uniref:Heme transporter hrg1-B-like n=1 Tax=Acanthaster planci TaxID=133434 RepID=A0A8B7Z2K2_ACAPL|nr:heme transporter hrg1-B-like [Acanthaster planci]
MSHLSSAPDVADTASSQEIKDDAGLPTPAFSSTSTSTQKQPTAMEPTPTAMRCRIGLAVTGISVGVLVFIVFLAMADFRNYHIACWGLASGIFAVFTLIVHIQHLKGNHDVWLNRLKLPIILGFFVQLGAVAAFITYIALAAVQKQPVTPLNGPHRGYYVAAVWVFMTWKWSFALFWYSKSYRRFYITKYVSIP